MCAKQPEGLLNAWGLWSMKGLVRYLHLKRASHSEPSTEEVSFWQVVVAGRHERSSRICELNTKPKPLSERHSPIELTHLNQGWCVQKHENQSKHDSGPLSTLIKALWEKRVTPLSYTLLITMKYDSFWLGYSTYWVSTSNRERAFWGQQGYQQCLIIDRRDNEIINNLFSFLESSKQLLNQTGTNGLGGVGVTEVDNIKWDDTSEVCCVSLTFFLHYNITTNQEIVSMLRDDT